MKSRNRWLTAASIPLGLVLVILVVPSSRNWLLVMIAMFSNVDTERL
ncbi:MAG: hypothetical protein ABIJ86_05560 [Spirochaetota bacterium]